MLIRWGAAPFLRIVLPFAFGIIAVVEWQLQFSGDLVALSAFVLGLLVLEQLPTVAGRYTRRHWFGWFVWPIYFLSGMVWARATDPTSGPFHYAHADIRPSHNLMLKILDYPSEKAKSYRYEAELIGYGDSVMHESVGKVLLYMSKEDSLVDFPPGTILLCGAELKECEGPKNPGEFNYKKYLRYQGISHQIMANSDNTRIVGFDDPGFTFRGMFVHTRAYFMKILESAPIEKRELGVLSALVLGNKELLDKEMFQSYSAAGAMHVLAVSGLHVGLFYVVVLWLFGLFFGRKRFRWVRFGVVFAALWFYAGVTGFSPSVSRAALMFTFIALGAAIERKHSIYNTLAMSAFCLLIYNPRILFEVGFQLSYLAVIGIVAWSKKFETAILVRNKWLNKVWQLMSVSFSAQLATFPLGLLYFHQFPTYFLFSNLLVIPVATFLLYLTLVFFLISPVPEVGYWVAWSLDKCTRFLNESVKLVESLPHAQITGVSISVLEVYVLYGLIWTAILFFSGYGKKYAFWALGCMLFIAAEEAHESYRLNRAREICIHAIDNKVAITAFYAGEGVFLNSDSLFFDRGKLSYHVGHYWDDLEVSSPVGISFPQDSIYVSDIVYWQRPVLVCGDTELVIVAREMDLPFVSEYPESVVLLHGKVGLKAFLKSPPDKLPTILLTNTRSDYYLQQLDSLAQSAGSTHINLLSNGYYKIESH